MTIRDLKEVAKAHGVKDYKEMKKEELVEFLSKNLKSPEKNLKSKKSVTTLLVKDNVSSDEVKEKKTLPLVDPKILLSLQNQILPKKRGRKPKAVVASSNPVVIPKQREEKPPAIVVEENTEIIEKPKKKKLKKKVKKPKKKSMPEPPGKKSFANLFLNNGKSPEIKIQFPQKKKL